MKREIKFRIFSKKENKIVICASEAIHWNKDFNKQINKNYILMQFTGLKDKDGKELYEGDIIKAPGLAKPFDIYFLDGSFVGRGSKKNNWIDLRIFEHDKNKITFWELVGNIYENKGLLNKK